MPGIPFLIGLGRSILGSKTALIALSVAASVAGAALWLHLHDNRIVAAERANELALANAAVQRAQDADRARTDAAQARLAAASAALTTRTLTVTRIIHDGPTTRDAASCPAVRRWVDAVRAEHAGAGGGAPAPAAGAVRLPEGAGAAGR